MAHRSHCRQAADKVRFPPTSPLTSDVELVEQNSAFLNSGLLGFSTLHAVAW